MRTSNRINALLIAAILIFAIVPIIAVPIAIRPVMANGVAVTVFNDANPTISDFEIIDPSVPTEITARLVIEGVTPPNGVNQWGITLIWSSRVLKFIEAKEDDFLNEGNPANTIFIADPHETVVYLTCLRTDTVEVSGGGILAKVRFSVKTTGHSYIEIYGLSLRQNNLETIKSERFDGLFWTRRPAVEFTFKPDNPHPNEKIFFHAQAYDPQDLFDIDFSGLVDIFDLVAVATAYGSTAQNSPPGSTWNRNADTKAQYNIIDIFDLVNVGSHFGWGDPISMPGTWTHILSYTWSWDDGTHNDITYPFNAPFQPPPTQNPIPGDWMESQIDHIFTEFSQPNDPYHITCTVDDGDSTWTYSYDLNMYRGLAIFAIWPSIEDYMGTVSTTIEAGKWVTVMIRTCNVGTVYEYTNNSKGDFPSNVTMGLYLRDLSGTEHLVYTRAGGQNRRYWYSDDGTNFYRKYDWAPGVSVSHWFLWDTFGLAPGNYYFKANLTALSNEEDLTDNELTFGPITIIMGYDHDVRIDGVYTYDDVGYYTPIPPDYGTDFNYFYGGKFGTSGGSPHNPTPPGTIHNITVGLSNVGAYDETVTIHIYAGTTEIATDTQTLTVATRWYEFTYPWDTTGWDEGTYTVSVYVEPVPGETQLWNTWDNNLPTQPIPYFNAYDDWGICTTFP